MQTNEPINTIPIQQFIQVVKTAEGSNQKEIRIPLTQAKALAYALGTVMANHQGRLEKLIIDKLRQESVNGITEKYNWDCVTKEYLEVFKYLVSKGNFVA